MLKQKKGALEISFKWIFALILGAIILFLAIFLVSKMIKTGDTEQSAKTSKNIGVLTNNLETGFASGVTNTLSMPVETRIYNDCVLDENFGRQRIRTSQKSLGKWTETDLEVGFPNKYYFSSTPVEGKEFFLFSKPFEFPFKVADLIYITSADKKYCFINPREDIEEEIDYLDQKNILLGNNCTGEEIKVCFSGSFDCDIIVEDNFVTKDGKILYYEGDALMYAAIFSDVGVYECQVKRLMLRTIQLASLYKDKENFVGRTGCSSNLAPDLSALMNMAHGLATSDGTVSGNLASLMFTVDEIDYKNTGNALCRLW